MEQDYYACNGACHTPTPADPRYGLTEVVLYNPGDEEARVALTVFWEHEPPTVLPDPVVVGARTNQLLVMPDHAPDIFRGRGRWGARYRSTHPLLINSIALDGMSHPDARYQGGVQSVVATGLDHEWLYADGVLLDWTTHHGGDTSKAPFPFNELEHYHLLNPTKEVATVTLELQYRNRPHETRTFRVPPERLLTWSTEGQVPICEPFGVHMHSDVPIATSYVRYVLGLHGADEWGMHVHFALAGTPARTVT